MIHTMLEKIKIVLIKVHLEQDNDKIGNDNGKPPYKKGGATKAAKFAALAPPYNKATFADRIAGAKKSVKKKK
jgi:hypothetical protein